MASIAGEIAEREKVVRRHLSGKAARWNATM
jgi:hypothetical protein